MGYLRQMKMNKAEFSAAAVDYLYGLKSRKRFEAYETVLLLLLNNKFRQVLENELQKYKKKAAQFSISGLQEFEIDIETNEDYLRALKEAIESKYFTQTFKGEEFSRRITIANHFFVEIVSSTYLQIISGKNIKVATKYFKVNLPNISHLYNPKTKELSVTFHEDSHLNDVVEYLRMIGVKNHKTRKKESLGQAVRMLQIDDSLHTDKQSKGYIEFGVIREMEEKYGEKITFEQAQKALQRVKRIRKDMNTPITVADQKQG
jgi:hypothetical protein